MATLKIEYNGDLRRVNFRAEDLQYSRLVAKIQVMFDISPQQQIGLKYTDNDGDLITVRSQEELDESFRSQTSQIFRFKVCIKLGNEDFRVNNQGLPAPVEDILKNLFGVDKIKISIEQDSPVIHQGITCDGCSKSLVGIRYKCTSCFDFDLCENCESKSEHDPEHLFLKIKNPLPCSAFQWRDPIFHYNKYRPRQFGPHCGNGNGNGTGNENANAPQSPFGGRCPRSQRHFQQWNNLQRPQGGCPFRRRQCEPEVPQQPIQEQPVVDTQSPPQEQPKVVEEQTVPVAPQEEVPQEPLREEVLVEEPVIEQPVRVLDELEVALSQLVDMGFAATDELSSR